MDALNFRCNVVKHELDLFPSVWSLTGFDQVFRFSSPSPELCSKLVVWFCVSSFRTDMSRGIDNQFYMKGVSPTRLIKLSQCKYEMFSLSLNCNSFLSIHELVNCKYITCSYCCTKNARSWIRQRHQTYCGQVTIQEFVTFLKRADFMYLVTFEFLDLLNLETKDNTWRLQFNHIAFFYYF